MFQVWKDFLEQPQVFISVCAAITSIIALITQFIIFNLNGSRIKVTMSLSFYEPRLKKTFDYPIKSNVKSVLDDPKVQDLTIGNIKKEFNNAEGIELLKVTISNIGRFPAKINDISFGYKVYKKIYHHYSSKYTIGLFPYVPLLDNISFPLKIEGGDETILYFDFWDAFRDLQNTSGQKSNLKIYSYIKIAGKKHIKKSKDYLELRKGQTTTLDRNCRKIPLRVILARFFYGKNYILEISNQTNRFSSNNYWNFSLISRLLESFFGGKWPESYSQQVESINDLFCFYNNIYSITSDTSDSGGTTHKVLSDQILSDTSTVLQIVLDLPSYVEQWKDQIDWSDIYQPDLFHNLENEYMQSKK